VQFGPELCAGTERQQTYRLATAAQRHHEQPRAPILAALGIAHHRAGAVIDLCFLAGCGDDDDASFGRLRSAPLAHEALHTLVAAGETVPGDQVLPDGPRIAAAAEPQVDGLAVRLAGAGAGDHDRVGDHLSLVGRLKLLLLFRY
jgi:hypothetical protein